MASDDFGGESNPDRAATDMEAARGVLRDLDDVRAKLGRRLATPWWYKAVSASLVFVICFCIGLPYESIALRDDGAGIFLVVFTVVFGPNLLRFLLKRSTGASFARYKNWTIWTTVEVVVMMACLALATFSGRDLAPIAGAGIAFVITYLYEMQIDRRVAQGDFPLGKVKV